MANPKSASKFTSKLASKLSPKAGPKDPLKDAPKDGKKPSRLASLVKAALGGGSKAPVKGSAPSGATSAKKPANAHAQGKASPAKAGKAQVPAKAANTHASTTPAKKGKGKESAREIAAAAQARVSSVSAAMAKVKGGAAPKGRATRADDIGESVCREVACEGLATSGGYCRMHYIKNWKKIKRKELILKEGKLNQYIEELVAKYPDKYIEAIRQDLASEKDFAKVIYDLDLDESVDDFEVEGENVDQIIDTIKRDFDDEGEGF